MYMLQKYNHYLPILLLIKVFCHFIYYEILKLKIRLLKLYKEVLIQFFILNNLSLSIFLLDRSNFYS